MNSANNIKITQSPVSKKLQLPSRKWIVLGLGLVIILFGMTRLTVIGQFVDDVFFRLIFGWLRWVVYPFLILISILWIFNVNWKQYLQKWNWKKVLWFAINLWWMLGFVTAFVLVHLETDLAVWKYSTYNLNLIKTYFIHWKENSVFGISQFDIGKFFQWNGQFLNSADGAGFISLLLAIVSSYVYIFVAVFLNFCSWILMFCYFYYGNSFFFLISKEKRKQKKWEQINQDPRAKLVPRISIRAKEADYTMELPSSEKIFQQEKAHEITKQQESLQNNSFKTKEKNAIRESNWEIPDAEVQQPIKTSPTTLSEKDDLESTAKNRNFLFPEYEPHSSAKKTPIKNDIPSISPSKTDSLFYLPSANLFTETLITNEKEKNLNRVMARKNQEKIESVLKQYNVAGIVTGFYVGPNITKYEIQLEKSVRVQRVLDLDQELQLELANKRVRIEAPIPGKSAVGIEIPNPYQTAVSWNSILPALQPESYSLKLGIGKNIMNETEILHLERLPHLLVAGQTGGGKSVCLTTIIASLLFQKTPKELKLLLIDPKRVEMSVFKNIPHLLAPVITNIELVPLALDKIIKEIEKRYVRMEQQGLNNIFRFNKKNSQQKMPFIVVIIDELADLILSYRKNVESKIVKICQIARAVGIYLIVATQRPSSDIITGLIKTNIPGRIAFNVTNYIDSRTILNTSGAEKLLGKGDLLFNKPGQDGLQRAQGAFLQESEIHTLTTFWKKQSPENFYWSEFTNLATEFKQKQEQNLRNGDRIEFNDELYEEVKSYVQSLKHVSVSLLQRRFNIGFNRAANIFEQLELEKIISAAEGNKPREVIKHENSKKNPNPESDEKKNQF